MKSNFGLAAAVAAVFSATAASAAVITIDFDSSTITTNGTANATAQTYLQGIVPGTTLSGAGVQVNNGYTGDGYVVGPVSGTTVAPATLGSTDHGTTSSAPPSIHAQDKYLFNKLPSDRIIITFGSPIYGLQFDYEIFPNGSCPRVSVGCPNTTDSDWPDFSLVVDNAVTPLLHTFGAVPAAPGFTHSPRSGVVNNELAPQFLGVSPVYIFAGGATKFEFIDWPVRIGIDNLVICTGPCSPREFNVPEPASLALFGIAALGFAGLRRRTGAAS